MNIGRERKPTVDEIIEDLLPFVVQEFQDHWLVGDKTTREVFTVRKIRGRFIGPCSCGRSQTPGEAYCPHRAEVRRILFDRWIYSGSWRP